MAVDRRRNPQNSSNQIVNTREGITEEERFGFFTQIGLSNATNREAWNAGRGIGTEDESIDGYGVQNAFDQVCLSCGEGRKTQEEIGPVQCLVRNPSCRGFGLTETYRRGYRSESYVGNDVHIWKSVGKIRDLNGTAMVRTTLSGNRYILTSRNFHQWINRRVIDFELVCCG